MSNPIVSRCGALVVLLLSCGSLLAAEKTKWLRFTTPHFELYTDAGERKGRDALKRLDQLRQVLQSIPRSQNGPPAPVRVYVFENDREYRNFRPPAGATGFSASGPDRDYLVMRGTGGDTYRTIFHDYTHAVLNRSSMRLPRWVEEGTAEYYSMTEPDGKQRAKLGKPVSVHQTTLRRTTQWVKPDTLQALRRYAPIFNEQSRKDIVYAQSWAMMHQLIASDRYDTAIPRFSELLADGTGFAAAFLTAFGVPVETAWSNLTLYAKANKYRQKRFGLGADTISSIKGERLSGPEVTLRLAELHLLVGNDEQAEAMLKPAATAESLAVLGTVALRRRDFDSARTYFVQAVERNPQLAAAHFGVAAAIGEAGGDPQSAARSLQTCVDLSPNFAQALYMLGQMAGSSKQHAEAAAYFDRAAAAAPSTAAYWHALSIARHQLKQTEAARRAAYKAYFASATDEESSIVRAALDLVDGRQVQVAAKKADVSAAASIADRKGDTRLEGTLIRVDCIGDAARFHVLTGEKRVLLHAHKPQEISLKNSTAETREFECGPQKRLAVRVEYNARPDAGLRSSGDVVVIEFKRD